MGGRVVLHSDLNNCYASIECMLHPELRGKYIAVCGSTEDRHGIVLAKNQLAKQCGVKTGEVIWEARQKCPQLTIVPPHMDQYLKFSRIVRAIYLRYSPEVESFGIDESWIELTGSPLLAHKTPAEIANEIRKAVKEEVGLTVSIGVSFNKIFAKLGSDMKKPDAVTEITEASFKEQIWPLPASELLCVGRATTERLRCYGIHTIGDLAKADRQMLIRLLGINGEKLWIPKLVKPYGYQNVDGKLVVDEEEAGVVIRIFAFYLGGKTPYEIAKILTHEGIPTPTGKKPCWTISSVTYILGNDRYCGDVIMQKSLCVDLFAHKRVRNLGQVERYRMRDVHPPLISKEEWREAKNRISMPDREAVILEEITGEGILSSLHPILFKEDIDV